MATFERIYPAQGRMLFDGGKSNKFDRSIIPDNESPDCLNVIFKNGAVETRGGSSKINTASVGSFACDALYVKHDDSAGSQTMVAFYGGDGYTLTATSLTTIPSAQSLFTAGVRMGGAEYENYLFLGNGGQIAYKYKNAEFTRHGVYAPTTTSTVASQAVGVLTGDYNYKVTFVNSNLVESDVGPATATFAAAGATLRVSAIPVAPQSFGVGTRRIYRTEAGGTTYKRLTTVADNTTTTYDDNNADGALGVTAPTDNGVPPKYNAIVYHQNRLFVNDTSNLNYVWYSELGDPFTFKTTNFIKIGDNTSDSVRGFSVYDNSLLVFCDESIHMIYMSDTDAANWQTVRVKSPYGSKSPYGYALYKNQVFFPAIENNRFAGFGAVSGRNLAQTSSLLTVFAAGSDLISDRIEPDMFTVQDAYVANISTIVFKNRIYATVTYDTANTTNNRIYVYDFSISNLSKRQEGAWVPYSGVNAAQFALYNGNLYYGSATANGFLYQLETSTYNDDGVAINSYFWTKELSGVPGDEGFFKDFRHANILFENAGAYFMNINYRVDSDRGDGNASQIDVTPGGSLWGTMVWGVDDWNPGKDADELRQFLGGLRGKRVQFRFSNQNVVNQKFKVFGLNMIYNNKGRR